MKYWFGCLLLIVPVVVAAIPRIDTWQTTNGARVLFVQAPELPMVDVRVAFDAGSARDGGRPGTALLANGMLSEGAGGLSAEAISERVENAGGSLSNSAQRDVAWVGMRSLMEHEPLDIVSSIFRRVLQQPNFPHQAFERARTLTLTLLQQRQQSPDAVADNAFFQALYARHPYGTPVEGDVRTLRSLHREELAAFHRRYYVGRNAVVGIVGGLSRMEAERLVDTLIGHLPEGELPPPLPAVPDTAASHHIKLPFPSSQSHILMGQILIARDDPDFFALYLANHILGGSGLVSVLADQIREQRGLSYGVSSHFDAMRVPGPFSALIQTRNDQADEGAKVLRQTVADFVRDGPSDEQLQAAVKNIVGGFPLRIDSNAKILDYLVAIGFYHLPMDYLEHFVEHIQRLTKAEIKDALQRRLHPERFVQVVVGGRQSEAAQAAVGKGERAVKVKHGPP